MAIFTNLAAVPQTVHGIWRSSKVKSTIAGHIHSARVQETQSGQLVDIDVDNGVAISIKGFTGDGLEERLATIAAVTDKICVTANVPTVKTAMTKAQADETNFYTKAGQLVRSYEIYGDPTDGDIFGVGLHQFSNATASDVAVGAYVKVDGNGGWTAVAAKPDAEATGFIGQIHSIQKGLYYSVVNIFAIQNKDVA